MSVRFLLLLLFYLKIINLLLNLVKNFRLNYVVVYIFMFKTIDFKLIFVT